MKPPLSSALFDHIKLEVEANLHGWTTVEMAQILACFILATRPKLILEIGVWAGRSFIPMAMTLKHLNCGKIIGIDPWNAGASSEGQQGDHLKWWSEADHEIIFNHFKTRLDDSGAASFAEVHRCRSDEFKLDSIGEIDIAHLDGNHGKETSYYDVTHFCPKIRRGGYLFMDDTEWAEKACDAVQDFGFKMICSIQSEVIYQRTA